MGWMDLTVQWSPTNFPLNFSPTYVDITEYVETIRISRGRSDELSQFNSGTCQIKLRNDDRRFDPTHSTGPYYGNLEPKKQFLVMSDVNPLYKGFCKGFPQDVVYIDNRAYANVTCSDAFEAFSAMPISESFAVHSTTNDPDLQAWYRFKDSSNVVDGVTSALDACLENRNDGRYVPGPAPFKWSDNDLIKGGSSFTPDGQSWIEILEPVYSYGSPTQMTIEFTLLHPTMPITSGNVFGGSFLSATIYDVNEVSFGPGTIYFGIGLYNFTTTAYQYFGLQSNNTIIGAWHHYVVTINCTTKLLTLYIDGHLEDQIALNPAHTFQVAQSLTERMRIGRGSDAGAAVVLEPGAKIGEILFYETAKSASWAENRFVELTGFPGERSGDRITRILRDIAGWSLLSTSIALGDSIVTPDISGTVLSAMQRVAAAELGLLFMSAGGNVVFLNRNFYLSNPRSNTIQAKFGGDGTGYPYVSVTPSDDDQYIYNVGECSREGGQTFTAVNTTSATYYFRRVSSKTGLALFTDNEAQACAHWLANRQAFPTPRILELKVDCRASVAVMQKVRSLEIGDRIEVTRKPQNVGSAWSVEGIIDGITHDIDLTNRTWFVTFKLAPIDREDVLVLGGVTDQIGNFRLGF